MSLFSSKKPPSAMGVGSEVVLPGPSESDHRTMREIYESITQDAATNTIIGRSLSAGGMVNHQWSPELALNARLGLPPHVTCKGATWSLVGIRKAGDKYLLFILAGTKGIVLEDEQGLYPSDALVTRLRLLD